MKRCIVLLLLLAAGTVAAWFPLRDAVPAVRLTLALGRLAAGDAAQGLPVEAARVTLPSGGRDLAAQAYRRTGASPERAVVLVPGISEQGIFHPRLIALSRSLADFGFLVLTPDIRPFREFRIDPAAMDEIAFWVLKVVDVPGGEKVQKTGVAGISFSGTLSLMAAARPELRDRTAFVLGIGAYDDPARCSREWLAAGPVTAAPGTYPTRYYGRWILMLEARELLPDAGERDYIRSALLDLLLQRPPSPPPQGLSPEGRRWLRLAAMSENEEEPELAQRIEQRLASTLFDRITPARAAAEVRCPVFLVHGAHDDLIPPGESSRLRRHLTGTRSYLLVSPFLTHTHPFQQPLSKIEKARAVVDFLGFFYRFARDTR